MIYRGTAAVRDVPRAHYLIHPEDRAEITTVETKEKTVRDPVQSRGIRTKQKIVEAGATLFSERGYHNVTADEIARAAGASVGTFYAYFVDKRDLFLAVLDDYFTQCNNVVIQRVGAFSSVERINASSFIMDTINLLVSVHRTASPLLNEILKMSLADDEVKRRLDEVDARITALIEGALIRAGMDKRRAAAKAFVIYHAGEGIIHQIVLSRQQIDEEAVLSGMTRLFGAYLTDIM
jgi:AcrR family transcriptional regulator